MSEMFVEDAQKHRSSEANFKQYTHFVKKWINKLYLQFWDVHTVHSSVAGEEDQFDSWVLYSRENLLAQISLAKEMDVPYNAESGERFAFHECMHLLMAPLTDLIESPAEIVKVAQVEEHKIISVLENVLFGKGKYT